MIVITRQRDQVIMLGDDIEVVVVDIRGDKVRLGVTHPKEVSVHRKEVYDAIRRANAPAIGDSRQAPARPIESREISIRLAMSDDLVAINDIYNWYVPRSTCTYQEEPEPIESRRQWFAAHQNNPRHPVTVALAGNDVVGWGSLSGYRERSAYRFTCENSVYVRHDLQGRGIGSALLADLIERAKLLDYRSIIAGIDGEQTASIALHAKFGFVDCGRQVKVGYKFDRWLDVVFMQKTLR